MGKVALGRVGYHRPFPVKIKQVRFESGRWLQFYEPIKGGSLNTGFHQLIWICFSAYSSSHILKSPRFLEI